MAGSRKGEKRGGARDGRASPKLRTPRFNPSTGSTSKSIPKKTREGIPNLITGEREREMLEIITGRRELMPKDVQLETMRTLYSYANEYQAMMRLAMMKVPTTEAERIMFNNTVDHAENKMVQYLMLASQVARDVAPFFHPRLAAIALKTDRKTEGDLFDLLMQEINEQPRFKIIEHQPDEKKQEVA